MQNVYLAIVLSPLLGAIIAGLFGRKIGRAGAHWVTILGVAISFLLSLVVVGVVLALQRVTPVVPIPQNTSGSRR